MHVIYVDVLFILNLYVNYFILTAAKKLTGFPAKKLRIFFASLFGAALSVIYFFCQFGAAVDILFKLLSAVSLAAIAFGFRSKGRLLRGTLSIFIISAIFAGIMFAITIIFSPSWMINRSGVIYINISAVMLAVFTLICYGAISLFDLIASKKSSAKDIYDITVCVDGKEAQIRGLMDSGNALVDHFTGKAMVICEFNSVKSIIPAGLHEMFYATPGISKEIDALRSVNWDTRYRVVPFHSLGGDGLLAGFKPDRITLRKNGKVYSTDSNFVAVYQKELSQGEYEAIFNPKLLNEITERGAV